MTKKILDRLRVWLSRYPAWGGYGESLCLLPVSCEEISGQVDMMGNSVVEYRYYVNLYWKAPCGADDGEAACRLLDFQDWVREQNALHKIPQFGDLSPLEQIVVTKGGFTPDAQVVDYTATLAVNFAKVYEMN